MLGGDLERMVDDGVHRSQRCGQPPCIAGVQYVNPPGSQLDGGVEPGRIDQPAVHVLPPLDDHRGEDAGDCRRRQHCRSERTVREHRLRSQRQVDGDSVERHRQVFEVVHLQVPGNEPGQPAAFIERRFAPHHVPGGPPPDDVERAARHLAPDFLQLLYPLQVGAVGKPGTVPSADRHPYHEVRRDVPLDQRPQHADLDGPARPTPRNRKRGPSNRAGKK